mgnify:CR=1 FL=1
MSAGRKLLFGGLTVFCLALAIVATLLLLMNAGCLTRPAPATPTPTMTATLRPPPLTLTPTKTATPAVRPTMTATARPTLTLVPPTRTPGPTATFRPTATPFVGEHISFIGWASYYATGVFQQTMDAHREWAQYPPDLPPGEAVAVADCRWKRDGRQIYLRALDATTRLPMTEWLELYVVDCAGDQETADWMERNNIIVEVDESLWDEWRVYRNKERGLLVEMVLIE